MDSTNSTNSTKNNNKRKIEVLQKDDTAADTERHLIETIRTKAQCGTNKYGFRVSLRDGLVFIKPATPEITQAVKRLFNLLDKKKVPIDRLLLSENTSLVPYNTGLKDPGSFNHITNGRHCYTRPDCLMRAFNILEKIHFPSNLAMHEKIAYSFFDNHPHALIVFDHFYSAFWWSDHYSHTDFLGMTRLDLDLDQHFNEFYIKNYTKLITLNELCRDLLFEQEANKMENDSYFTLYSELKQSYMRIVPRTIREKLDRPTSGSPAFAKEYAKTLYDYKNPSFSRCRITLGLLHYGSVLSLTRHNVDTMNLDLTDYTFLNKMFNFLIMRIVETFHNSSDITRRKMVQPSTYDHEAVKRVAFLALRNRDARFVSVPFYMMLDDYIWRWFITKNNEFFEFSKDYTEKSIEYFEVPDMVVNMLGISGASASIKKLTSTLERRVEETRETQYKAEQLIDKIDSLADKADHFFDSATEALQAALQSLTESFGVSGIIMSIGKIFSFFFLLADPINRTFSRLLALVTLVVPTSMGNMIATFASSLTLALQGVVLHFDKMRKQGETEIHRYSRVDNPNYSDAEFTTNANEATTVNETLVESIYSLIKNTVIGLFSPVDKARLEKLKIDSHKSKILHECLRTCKTIVSFLTTMGHKILQFLGDQILKSYGVMPSWLRNDEVSDIINEYVDMKKHGRFDAAKRGVGAATELRILHERSMKLEADINISLSNSTMKKCAILPYLAHINRTLDEAWKEIPPNLQDSTFRGRSRPFCVWIHGLSGVGKSSVVQAYIINAIVMENNLLEDFDDPDNYSYFRDIGEEYWEGYANQPVVQYNDIFQSFADDEYLNRAVREFTSVNDDIIYPVNMAFGGKGKTYFTSPLVVINAQEDIVHQAFIKNKAWSGGVHIFRRRHIVVEVLLNIKYRKDTGTSIDLDKINKEMTQNPHNVIGDPNNPLFPKDCYKLRFTDPITGRELFKKTFEEGLAYIVSESRKAYKGGNVMKDRLISALKYDWKNSRPNSFPKPVMLPRTRSPSGSNSSRTPTRQPVTTDNSCTTQKKENTTLRERLKQAAQEVENSYKKAFEKPTVKDFLKKSSSTDTESNKSKKSPKKLRSRASNYDSEDSDNERDKEKRKKEIKNCRDSKYNFTTNGNESVADSTEGFIEANAPQTCNHCEREFRGLLAANLITQDQHDELYFALIGDHEKCFNLNDIYNILYNNQKITKEKDYFEDFRFNALLAYEKTVSTMRELYESIPKWPLYIALVSGLGVVAYFIRRSYDSNPDLVTNTAEVNNRAPKDNNVARFNNATPNFTTHGYDQTNRDIEKSLKGNFVYLRAFVSTPTKEIPTMCGTAINLKGDIFVMPRHYWHRFMEYKKIYDTNKTDYYVRLYWSHKQSTKIFWDTIVTYEPTADHLEDVIFIRIRNLCNGRNIAKFFQLRSDENNLVGSYLYGIRGTEVETSNTEHFETSLISVSKNRLIATKYHSLNIKDPLFKQDIEQKHYSVPKSYMYSESCAFEGDCGMVLMSTDNKYTPRKILGFHVAGSRNTNQGVSCYLTQEDIKMAFANLSIDPIICDSDITLPCTEDNNNTKQFLITNGFSVDTVLTQVPNPANGKYYKVDVRMPNKTKISKSLIFDMAEKDFGRHNTQPVNLAPYRFQGKDCSPLLNAIQKHKLYSEMFSQKDFDEITNHILETTLAEPSRYNNGTARLLTLDECVNGFGPIDRIDMKTSPGFPYTNFGYKKSDLFPLLIKSDGIFVYDTSDIVKHYFEEAEQQCLSGIAPEIYWCDMMKDETRPIHKLDKPRIFEVGPVHHTLLMRKYFGYYQAHLYETYIGGESAIGINPNSEEWNLFTKTLLKISDVILNGDYKNFDASLAFQLAMAYADMVSTFYSDGSINRTVRRCLMASAAKSKHILRNVVFTLLQGNPSGFFCTGSFNNFCNQFFFRYGYRSTVTESLKQFHELVKLCTFGDDNIATVSNAIRDDFNMITMKNILSPKGITYTDANKNDQMDPYIYITEASFLKRGFYYSKSMKAWISRLDKNVITELIRWSASDPHNMKDQLNRFNSALYEMSNYGKQDFLDLRSIFVDYCNRLSHTGYDIKALDLFDYNFCKSNMYPKYFPDSRMIPNYEESLFQIQSVPSDQEIIFLGDESTLSTNGSNESVQALFDDFVKDLNVAQAPLRYTEEDLLFLDTIDFSEFQVNSLSFRNSNDDTSIGNTLAESVETSLTSTLVDYGQMEHQENIVPELPYQDSHMEYQPDNVLFAPFLIRTLTVNTTHTVGTTLGSFDFPDEFSRLVRNKARLQNYMWWRPEFELTFRINGTATNYGAIMAAYYPSPDFLPLNFYLNRYGSKWIQMSLNTVGETSMDIPYTSEFPFIRVRLAPNKSEYYPYSGYNDSTLKPFVADPQRFGNVRVYVAIPMTSASGGSTAVSITVWLRLKKCRFIGTCVSLPYGYPTNRNWTTFDRGNTLTNEGAQPLLYSETLTVQGLEHNLMKTVDAADTEDVSASNKGVISISKTTKDLGTLAGNFVRIPLIGSYAALFTNAAFSVSKFFKALGLSMTVNQKVPEKTLQVFPLLGQCEELTNTQIAGPSQDIKLHKGFEYCYGRPEDYSILALCQKMFLIHTGNMTGTNKAGHILWWMDLTPMHMYGGRVSANIGDATSANNYNMAGLIDKKQIEPSAMFYFARFFKYWRGSMRFYIKFFCTPYHSVRMRVIWVPKREGRNNISLFVPTNIAQSENYLNYTYDVVGECGFGFTIPYFQQTYWSENSFDPFDTAGVHKSEPSMDNGTLIIMPVTTLNCSMTPITPVWFQLFVGAGNDFQFSEFDVAGLTLRGTPTILKTPAYEPDQFPFSKNFVANSLEFNYFTTNGLENDSETILKENFPILGGASFGYTDSRVCQPHTFTGIRQLANMQTRVWYGTGTGLSINLDSPNHMWAKEYNNNSQLTMFKSPLSLVTTLFRFKRGGIRYVINVTGTSGVCVRSKIMRWQKTTIYKAAPFVTILKLDHGSIDLNWDAHNNGWESRYVSPDMAIDITVPYSSSLPCSNVEYENMCTGTRLSERKLYLVAEKGGNPVDMYWEIFMGAADDYMLGYYVGPPTMTLGGIADRPKKPTVTIGDWATDFKSGAEPIKTRMDPEPEPDHEVSVDDELTEYKKNLGTNFNKWFTPAPKSIQVTTEEPQVVEFIPNTQLPEQVEKERSSFVLALARAEIRKSPESKAKILSELAAIGQDGT